MLMLHGPGTPLKPPPAAPDEDPEDAEDQADADRYEDALFGLLVHLEHLRESLASPDRPAQVPAALGEVMDRVGAFAQESCPFVPTAEATEAEARLAEFRADLKSFQDELKEAGARALAADKARKCYVALYDAVFAHFVVFTNRFPTSRTARGWVEVAATFVTDLKRTLRDLAPAAPPAA
jgi:hypothetical protein